MFNQSLLQKRFQAFNFSNVDFFTFPIISSFKERSSFLKTPNQAISSFMELHWIDDPLLYFRGIHKSLKQSDPFQGCFIGGDSLYDIKTFFIKKELEICGKVAQRFSPLISPKSLIGLLNAAGFDQIVVDIETYIFEYSSFESMMGDLRKSGQKNGLTNQAYFPKYLYKSLSASFNQSPIPVVIDVVYWSCFKK